VIGGLKVAVLVFVASILEVSVFSDVKILGGGPDLLLVTIVAVALLRGSVTGACAGFFAGLVVDTATLETLGLSSLLLTLIGYWVGRYGETTGRDRTHAPFLSVAVVTFLYALGGLALRFVLGEPAPARLVLLDSLFQGIALNLLLTVPVYAVVRRLLTDQDQLLDAAQHGRRISHSAVVGVWTEGALAGADGGSAVGVGSLAVSQPEGKARRPATLQPARRF
jgi:rod shape-determining protein MreD